MENSLIKKHPTKSDTKMIYDIHTHIAGFNADNGNYVSDVTKRQITTSIFLKSMNLHRKDLLSAEIDAVIRDKYIN